MSTFTIKERALLIGILLLCGLTFALPPLPQNQHYHQFADARILFGINRAMDSLSNAGFLALGLYGLSQLYLDKLVFFSRALKWSAFTFFLGFIATAFGSTFYHVAPNDFGLAVDRLGMVIAFAGVIGMAAAHRISERAGYATLAISLMLGPYSVGHWMLSGSLTPYAMVQFGGIALALAMMVAEPRGKGPAWAGLLAAYALAKVCETADIQIYQMTGQWVSGHTLKHLFAALPVLAVTWPLRKCSGREPRA